MTHFHNARTGLALCALAVAMVACGDSGSVHEPVAGTPPAPAPAPLSDIPASATASSAGAFTFIKSVVESSAETNEPLTTADEVLAVSDTDEPDPSV